mgnify:CR=1 FL=1
MTGVVVAWLGVSSMWHAGTNKQYSTARGREEGEEVQPHAQPVNVTHPPPPQPPAQTSSHQPGVVGKRPVVWLCETRIPFSLSTHTTNAPGNEATEKWKRGRRSKWDGRGSHQQRQWVQSQPHGITAALPCLHMQSETAGRGREGVSVGIRCVQITRCARCAPTTQITHPLCHSSMQMACESAERGKRERKETSNNTGRKRGRRSGSTDIQVNSSSWV